MKEVIPSFSPDNAMIDPWVVFDFAIEMYFETPKAVVWMNEQLERDFPYEMQDLLKNSVAESTVLHTRILIDILISKKNGDDDVVLDNLLPQWCETDRAKELIDELKSAYGNARQPNSLCWIINKRLVHPTRRWSDSSTDFGLVLNRISEPIFNILLELQKITDRKVLKRYLS